MNDLFIGIDIGTSSSKGVLVDRSGRIVARQERPHVLSMPRPGWVEHDPESVWWADVVAIARELVAAADGRIAGLCVSGIGPCLLPVDSHDRPLRNAILYGIDTRASAQVIELTARYGDAAILKRGGASLSSQAIGPKLLWLRQNEPELWNQTRRFYMASSWIVHRLTGAYILDHHSASQCDPLYDMTLGTWALDWAAEIAPGLELPRLVWASEVIGSVSAEAAQATGIPSGTPVMAGTIDAWAEALSVGVREPGDTMLMYGTTMFVIEAVHDLRPSRALWGTAGVLPGSRSLAAGMATSGALTGWLRGIAGDPPFETLLGEAELIPAGSEGLVVLPYFAGERTPIFDPDARGVIIGLTLNHRRGHLYRALLEATAYGLRHILEAFEAAGAPPRRLVAVGGGTKGRLWTQIVSNVIGRPQEMPAETIGSAYGDALLAAIGSSSVDPDTIWFRPVGLVEPDPATAELYAELYAIFRSLYPATLEPVHRLANVVSQANPTMNR